MAEPSETTLPKQQQSTPGSEQEMDPKPEIIRNSYRGSGKLQDQVALITGGDSGIGRSAAVHFAREGADVAIVYLSEQEDEDAQETKRLIEQEGRKCLTLRGNLQDKAFAQECVEKTYNEFGQLDILVNNASEQHPHKSVEELEFDMMESTFKTNIFAMFYITKPALEKMKDGGAIINTTSVVSYQGRKALLDYSSSKGAITAFTRALSEAVVERNIRVNAVAPGPIWTPLIPATFEPEKVEKFGKSTPMGRPGQPSEVGPAYVFLASDDASYITGQVIHVNGGENTAS